MIANKMLGTHFRKGIPLYYQIESLLRFQIQSGKFPPGAKLPPETELCRIHGISQGTLRQALRNLEADEMIVRMPSKGTFVTERKKSVGLFPIEMRLVGFLNDLLMHEKDTEVVFLGESRVAASPEQAKFFCSREGEELVHFKRLKKVNGYQLYYVENWMLPQIGNEITKSDLLTSPPLEIFEKKLKRPIEHIRQEISVTKSDIELAQILDIELFEPVLHIILHVYEKYRKPLEIADLFCRADRYHIVAELTKRMGNS